MATERFRVALSLFCVVFLLDVDLRLLCPELDLEAVFFLFFCMLRLLCLDLDVFFGGLLFIGPCVLYLTM